MTTTKPMSTKTLANLITLLNSGELAKAQVIANEQQLPSALTEEQAEQLQGLMVLPDMEFEDYYPNPFLRDHKFNVELAAMDEDIHPLEQVSDYMAALIGASAFGLPTETNHMAVLIEAMESGLPMLREIEANRLEFNDKTFYLDYNKELVSGICSAKVNRISEFKVMSDMELMRLEIRLEMTGTDATKLAEVKEVIEARIAATKVPTLTEPQARYKESQHGDDIRRETTDPMARMNYSGDAMPQQAFNNRDMVVPVIGEEL